MLNIKCVNVEQNDVPRWFGEVDVTFSDERGVRLLVTWDEKEFDQWAAEGDGETHESFAEFLTQEFVLEEVHPLTP